jgi:hypothetical protein
MKNTMKINEKLSQLNFTKEMPYYGIIFNTISHLCEGYSILETEMKKIFLGEEIRKLINKGLIIKVIEKKRNYFLINPSFENDVAGLPHSIREPLKISQESIMQILKKMLGEEVIDEIVNNSCEVIAGTIETIGDYNLKLNIPFRDYLAALEKYKIFKERRILLHIEDEKGERITLHPSFIAKCKFEISNKS